MPDDPFSKYGGAAITDTPADDPFAKYGGAALAKEQPAQTMASGAPFGSQSSEQIVQDQTGIKPFSNPIAQSAAGVGRTIAAPVTGLVQAAKAMFTDPKINSPEEQAAQDQWGSLGLGVQRALVEPAEAAHNTANTLRSQGHPILAAGAELGALPVIGPIGQALGQRAAAGDIPGALAEGMTTAAGPAALKEALPVIQAGAGRAKQFIRPATSEAVVPPAQQAASSLAKAINPPGGVPEGLEDSLAAQTPGIRGYATRTGNPLNTRWELAKAALGHAQELNDFYDQHVLGPSADRPVPIEGTGYQGETNGNGKATLAQIDDRLSAINKLTRPAYDKANSGATMTALERMGLDNEAGALRQTLYNELAKDTGMTPDAIKKLRTDYGQSYDIASKTDAARRRVGTGGPVPLTKEGLIHSVLENVVGGRDAIADRGVQSALQQFRPALSPIDAMRQRVTGFRNQSQAAAVANQAAAQQEVLHSVDLGQNAQAAAAQRAQQAGGIRSQRIVQATDQNRQAANQEVLNSHALDTAAQDAAQERADHADALRGVHISGETRYRNGRAFVVDPTSGWWVPK